MMRRDLGIHFISAYDLNKTNFCPGMWWPLMNTTITIDLKNFTVRPSDVFVDHREMIYINDRSLNQTFMFYENSTGKYQQILHRSSTPSGLFVSNTGDIYVGFHDRVERWADFFVTRAISIFETNRTCTVIYVDQYNKLYCSLTTEHRIIMSEYHVDAESAYLMKVIAGNGTCQATSTSLCSPTGIYVDSNSNLYVADTNNDRIQLFTNGSKQGRTIVGQDGYASYRLARPTAITMDNQSYLLIADQLNHRIIRCTSSMCRCEIGCENEANGRQFRLSDPFYFMLTTKDHFLYILMTSERQIVKIRPSESYCSKSRPMIAVDFLICWKI